MNINKFTQKSLQAVQDCEKTAMEYGNQEIEQEHLLYALLTQDDSLILKMMEKMGLDKNLVVDRVEQAIAKRPKVQGGQPYVGQYLNKALISAEDEMKQMGDEYVSVEHLFLALLKHFQGGLFAGALHSERQPEGDKRQSGGHLRYPEQIRNRPGGPCKRPEAGSCHRT